MSHRESCCYFVMLPLMVLALSYHMSGMMDLRNQSPIPHVPCQQQSETMLKIDKEGLAIVYGIKKFHHYL